MRPEGNCANFTGTMPASLLTELHDKVRRAASEIVSLRKERERLAAEVSLMEEENKRARRLIREHQDLMGEREKMKDRLEQLMRKLDQLRV